MDGKGQIAGKREVLKGIQVWKDQQKLTSCRSEFWTEWKAHSHKMKELMSDKGWLIVPKETLQFW